MKRFVAASVVALAALLLLDGPWLTLMGPRFYAPRLAHLLSASPQWSAAGAFYLLYALGVALLVVLPALESGAGAGRAFGRGALLGLVAYGTYDLTNQATLRDWPVIVTLVDMAWGTFLTGVASAVAFSAARRMG